ncbi:MAG: PQQ-like beta-propeller repeat protein [Pirellulales bacterium]|nr:PQQ-like beta-propeller repeat protein [Pirellulales bacterium]
MSRWVYSAAILTAWLSHVAAAPAADWLQFRGTDNTGVSASTAPPAEFGDKKNVAWKVELPGDGVCGPIVLGDRVVVTASSGPRQDHLHILCFDAAQGKKLWQRSFWATGRTLHHPTSAVAANTPASDGEHIFAFYSSNDLICTDRDGNVKWLRGLTHDYPHAANDVGLASSPVVVDQVVVVQIECQGDSFAAGIDAHTGKNRWRIARPANANWASPTVLTMPDGRSAVVLQSGKSVEIFDPQTGKEIARYEGDTQTIPSTTVAGDVLFAPCSGLTALKLPREGSTMEVLWQAAKLSPGAASPVVYKGQVYALNRAGVLICGRAADGEVLWPLRLPGGPYWATPVAAEDRLYFASEKGTVHVVQVGVEKGEILASNELGEPLLGTPAVVDGALYVRGEKHLWKIAAP